jgi:aminoglycoside 6-adenylyltransferase
VEPNTDSLTPVEQRVGPFLDDVAAWAAEQDDVRAAVLLGSQARADTPADHLSDVDVVLFVVDPARYLHDRGWLERFGEPLLTFVEPTAVGGFEERRVLFRDGLEVDFAILSAGVAESPPQEAAGIFARGYRVLYDDGIGLVVPELREAEAGPPTQAQLDQLSNDFWYHLLWAAKKLRRGELLQAKQACDCFLKGYLVELTRWRRQDVDTWHGLRFFERWAGDDVVEALGPAFARYDAEDVARALRATGELFGELEDSVAELHGLRSPVDRSEVFRRLEALTSPPT